VSLEEEKKAQADGVTEVIERPPSKSEAKLKPKRKKKKKAQHGSETANCRGPRML
jgi:hypothetical protein